MSEFARFFEVRPHVQAALNANVPVVALETTVLAHGLPWPDNLIVARDTEQVVREERACPATVGILEGRAVIGLNDSELERFAQGTNVRKASSRDLASALLQQATAATTVAGTMVLARRAGIRVFATGGIGGVHPREPSGVWDVSVDLTELTRVGMVVVCAGAKSILDLPATLEALETLGVPVVGYKTADFPAFYVASSGLPVATRVESAIEAARLALLHWELGGAGVLLCQPPPPEFALSHAELAGVLDRAESLAEQAKVRGAARTPFLLKQLANLTRGRTLQVNRDLLLANARLAAQVATALVRGAE